MQRTIPTRDVLADELANHMPAIWAAKASNGRIRLQDIYDWLEWERHSHPWTALAIKHLAHDLRRGAGRGLSLEVDGVLRHLKSHRDTTSPRRNYWELAPLE